MSDSFSTLWRATCDQNPAIVKGDGTIRLKVDGLHKAMRLAFDWGVREGRGRVCGRQACSEEGSEVVDFLMGVMGKGRGGK